MYRPSPLLSAAFPILSVQEKAEKAVSAVELKGQQVKEKALEVAGEKPTGANLYARFVLSSCPAERSVSLSGSAHSRTPRGERQACFPRASVMVAFLL
jgi:hypothetical protein